ncbi:DUF1002 domain-containing protein [Sporosarcina pasteurii]|uniref:Predicted secreted protein n=1 Tax=Sporosarcina pasteurii TaxID=1474 RepID=A0A380CGW5_SPOPA|nr:DUF1002 domain-containing protein [Sporosarcina pasteurii]MDS9472152.1 DUF1002 domain-containing protein [Sporosarcina pasteurii]QBQ06865.1 DUF1002 domain-containing protein [Sporosarcina pasteurii]SUJ20348.1 Predicted secreted protein [Sporosarcina pasteurii]
MKRIGLLLTSFALLVAVLLPGLKAEAVVDEKLGVPIVVYGANLSEAEKASVKKSLGVENDTEVEEIYVDGSDLVNYIPDGNRHARMYSSAKITRQEAGKGLVIKIVTEENITQVSADMYGTAMLTAGVEDAIVEVAAPKKVTGHSALVGIYKAYEVSGEKLDTDRTDVANDELNLATKFAEDAGIDKDKVAELLTEIKKEIADKNPATREDVEQIVSDQLKKLNIELSETDRQLLIDLMDKIRNLNIDFGKLSDQLSDFGDKLKEKIGEIDPGFWEKVKEFFASIFESVKSWFN